MDGTQAQQPSFWELYEWYLTDSYNSYPWWYHSLLVVLCLAAVFLMLESFLPKKKEYYVLTRKGFFGDFVYMFFYDFLLVFLVVVGIDMVIETATNGKVIIYDIMTLSWWLIFPIIFVLNDFFNWLGHLLLHKVPFLWKFHKIHHAQEELGFGSTRHFHFMEYLVFRPLMYIPLNMLGVPPVEYFVFQIWMSFSFTFLSHANIQVNWGFLNYIFITPDTHYWHHAKNVKSKHSVNYASILCIWDQLFGYFYLPKKEEKLEPDLGLYDDDTPAGFFKQQVHPFKTLLKKEKFENFKTKK